jgi:Na+/alanine symporter
MTMSKSSARPFFFAMIAGILCGAALIATTILSKNGWLMLLPYVALALASAVYLRSRTVGPFSQRFVPCLIAYIVATAIVILYIDTVVLPHAFASMTPSKFLVRNGLMLLIGAAGSAVVAAITGERSAAR